jgi:hypothetical protein
VLAASSLPHHVVAFSWWPQRGKVMDLYGIGFVLAFANLTGRVIWRRWDPAWILGTLTWAVLALLDIF